MAGTTYTSGFSTTGPQGGVAIQDATVGASQEAAVIPFHNADNQVLANTQNGLNTGGVAQLLNAGGGIDRQRETSFDNVPSAGIASGAQQVAAAPINTTITTSAVVGSNNAQIVNLAAVSQVNRGVTQAIQVGSALLVDAGQATQEYVFVSAVAALTVTGVFKQNHNIGATVQAFAYNQARDATIADGSTPAGIAASATMLFNAPGNSVEFERSAAGELDGASGTGTNIAAEYEYNGGGPLTNVPAASGLSFDRARNLQGKGTGSATQNAGGAAGALSITASSAAAVKSLLPGTQIRIDRNTGNDECAYVASNYVPGTAAITLQSALANTHAAATIEWDIFASGGPGINGFNATGIGIEEEALFNPVDGKYYIERAATQDGVSANNVVLENPALWNGTTMDRQRGNFDTGALITAAGATTTQTSAAQINPNARGIKATLNVTNIGTGSVTLGIQWQDVISGVWTTILSTAAVVANSNVVITVYPGLAVTANVSANDVLPRNWRLQVTANNANAATYTASAQLIV